ncbi:hypothetical protein [Hyphomicrobium sp. LHD-15]|uniref:hypothetical protein n=1 Tax=Hyphomicrobium sp. LHD-15 TaxID=3072142 RepID=UPI00280F2A87|nr:hypothetical protein [Hyphomicrobium sp. LHD-15]MDQ8697208.1 hypothetical protein [Hyphomicrobium sp. LHD-15]
MKRSFCLLAVGQMMAGTAAADPYPFEGFFALKAAGTAYAGCGFDILHQSRSGAFSGYILDRRHWEAHGTPRFVRYKHGACTFDAASGIDNCVAHVNHISEISDKRDRAKVTVLDGNSVAMLTLGEEDDPEKLSGVPPFVFQRCPFDAAQIAPLLSDTAAEYSKTQLQEMARARDAGVSVQVLEAIRTQKTAVD